VKAKGPYGYVFNDFGSEFEVNDKNGEETVEVMIDSITNEEEGLVTLLSGQRHSYEDGEAVRISEVKGMNLKEGEGSINGTIHKIKVKNQHSFTIGDTSGFGEYEGNGLVRNMKLPISVKFKTYEETMKEVNIDGNL
jgi:ubiquitin-activating enzyme E1